MARASVPATPKRHLYTNFTLEQKAEIGEHGIAATIQACYPTRMGVAIKNPWSAKCFCFTRPIRENFVPCKFGTIRRTKCGKSLTPSKNAQYVQTCHSCAWVGGGGGGGGDAPKTTIAILPQEAMTYGLPGKVS